MYDYSLKEIRRHGDDMFPVGWYEVNEQNSLRYLSCHWHEELELFYVQKGRMKIRCGDDFYFADEGSMALFPGGKLHAADPVDSEAVIYRAVVFSPEFLCDSDGIRSKYLAPIRAGRIRMPALLDFIPHFTASFDRLFQLLKEKPFGCELEVKSILLSILFHALRAAQADAIPQERSFEPLKEVLHYIRQNYKKPLTIQELSALCGMSQGYFCRVFKRCTLKTPVQYINHLRVARAMELLLSGNRKILDIAMETGFNGSSYFIGVFQACTGTTPSRFRKEYGRAVTS